MKPEDLKSKDQTELDFKNIFVIFVRMWYVFAIATTLGGIVSFLYLRWTPSVYDATSVIKIDREKNVSEQQYLLNEQVFFQNDIQGDIEVIKSRKIIKKALKTVPFQIGYYIIGNVKDQELYKQTPFIVQYDTAYFDYFNHRVQFKATSENTFILQSVGKDDNLGEYKFGSIINHSSSSFKIVSNKNQKLRVDAVYQFVVYTEEALYKVVKPGLKVELSENGANIIKITYNCSVAEKCSDLANAIATTYETAELDEQLKSANQKLKFIDEQLASIAKEVYNSETSIEAFKIKENLTDIQTKAQNEIANLNIWKTKQNDLELRRMALTELKQYIIQNKDVSLLVPSYQEVINPILSQLLSQLMEKELKKKDLLKKKTENHPSVKAIDIAISEIKNSILNNIATSLTSNNSKLNYVNSQVKSYNNQLSIIPKLEKGFSKLEREYNINEKYYLMLKERKTEAEIAKASITSSVRIVDVAVLPKKAVYPVKNKIYLVGIVGGMIFGILLIALKFISTTTIEDRDEIQKRLNMNILAGIPRAQNISRRTVHHLGIISPPTSKVSEAFRALRTNLQFIAKDDLNKVIAVTSTISGEGKSFVAINTANIFASLGKKVIIVDLDMRRPRLYQILQVDNNIGITRYLIGKNTLEEVVRESPIENLDFITSGPTPPNPAELLASDEFKKLLMGLKTKYDYIILDTPPSALVTDAAIILQMASVGIYVFRAAYSKKNFTQIFLEFKNTHNLQHLYPILNAVKKRSGKYGSAGYGYGYGYGYYLEDKKDWFNKVKSIFRRK